MNIGTLVLGAVVILMGLYFVVARIKFPNKLKKYAAMRKKMGDKVALIVHTFFYSILPLVLGLLMIVAASNGVTVIELFKN